MPDNSAGLHEAASDLSPETKDFHRAIASVMEELEATDWYDQRIQAASDQGLKDILKHNRDEEMEHAAMVLEWLRRRDPALDENLRQYLFTNGSIVGLEDEVEGGSADNAGGTSGGAPAGTLGIGKLAGKAGL